MRNAVILLTLFLTITYFSVADMRVTKTAVGSGSFLVKTDDGKIKAAGIVGQPFVGASKVSLQGKEHNMYLGFWTRMWDGTGIFDRPSVVRHIHNHPNPVVDNTNFQFVLANPSFVTLNVYNATGVLVATIINNQFISEGEQLISWNLSSSAEGSMLSSGAYQYELIAVPVLQESAKPSIFRNMLIISK